MENLLKNDFLQTITSYFRKPWKFYTFEQLLELEGILRLLKIAVLEKMTILIETKTIQVDTETDLIQILRKFREFQEKILFFDLKVDYDYLLDLPFLPIMLNSLNSELIYEILFFIYNLVFIGNSLKKWSEDQKNSFFIFLSACLNIENYDRNIANYFEYIVSANNFDDLNIRKSLKHQDEFNENEIGKNHDSNTEFLNYFNLIKEEEEENDHRLFDELNYLILNADFKKSSKEFPKKSEEINSIIKAKILFFKTKFKDRLYTILSNIIMSELVTLGVKSLLISENNSYCDLPLKSFSSNFRDLKRSLLNLVKLENLPIYLSIRSFETLSLSTFSFENVILQRFYQPKFEIRLDENLIIEVFRIKFLENEKNWNLNDKFEKNLFIWFIKLADKIRFSYESLELQMKNNTDLSDFLSKIEESRKNLDDLMERITLFVFEKADLSFLIENIDLLIPIVVYFKTIYNQEKNRFFTCLFKNLLTLIDLCLSAPFFLQSQTFMEKVFDKYNEIEECILQLLQLFFVFETRTIFTENLNKEIISIDFFRKIMEIRMMLSSLEKNKTYFLIDFLSHFAFNQILFHSLTNDNNVMRDHVIELLEIDENLKNFLIIFDSFYNSNKVIFLCNFNLLRKRVLKILEDHMHNLNRLLEKDKETEIVKVYAKTYAYCFLLWADTSSLENDFIELKVLKPFYELSFEALFEKMSFSMGFDTEQLKIFEKNENQFKILEQSHNCNDDTQANFDLINISEERIHQNLFEPNQNKEKSIESNEIRETSNKLENSQANQSKLNQTIKKDKVFLNLLKQALSTKYQLVFENSLFFLKSFMFKLYEEKIPIEKYRYYLEKILIINSPLIGSFDKVREIKEIRINGFYDFSFESSQKQEGIQILYILFEMMRERYIWRRNKMEEFWIKLQFLEEDQNFQILHGQQEKECELLVMIISEFVSKMKFSYLNDKNIVDYFSDIFKCFLDDLMLYIPFLIQMHCQKFNQMRNPFNNKDDDEDQELMRTVDKIKYNKNFILRILKQIPLFLNLYKMFFSFIEKTSPKTPNISIEFRKLNYFLLKNMTNISLTLFDISHSNDKNGIIKHNQENHYKERVLNEERNQLEINKDSDTDKQSSKNKDSLHFCNCIYDENSNSNFECKCNINDLRILYQIITGFEILKKSCESLHESKLPLLFLNDSFFIKLQSILAYIHSLLKSNKIDYALIQSTETEQGYCFPQGRIFILVKLIQVIFNKIIINILPDFLLSDLLFSEFTIINDCLFTQILEKTITIFENSMLIWALIARNNEEIPIKFICIFEDFVLHPRTPRNNHRLETLAASLVSLFLKSTYVFRMRIRSIYLYKLVHKLVILRSYQDSALFLPLKNQYLLYFIQLLTYHFKEIYPFWDPFQHFPVLATLLSSSRTFTSSSSIFVSASPTFLLPSLSFLLPLSSCLPSRSSSLALIPHSFPSISSSLPPISSPSLHHVPSFSLPSSAFSLVSSSSLPSSSSSKIPHVGSSCLSFTASFLPPIESSCIHAMLSNLISRLLTCENSLHSEPVLEQGIRLMFWHWPASKGFCRYVIGLLRKVRENNERMSQEDLDTLHNDTIANLLEMMREEGEERRRREENSNKEGSEKEEAKTKKEEKEEEEKKEEKKEEKDEMNSRGKGRKKDEKDRSKEYHSDGGEFSWSDYYDLLRDFFREYVGLREKGGGCAARAEILKEIISLLAFEKNSSNDSTSKKDRNRTKKTIEVPKILEKVGKNELKREKRRERTEERGKKDEEINEYEEETGIIGVGEGKNGERRVAGGKEGGGSEFGEVIQDKDEEIEGKRYEKSEENKKELKEGKKIVEEVGGGKEEKEGEGEERKIQGVDGKYKRKEEKRKIDKKNILTRKEGSGLKKIVKFLDQTLDHLKLKREGHCDYIEKFSGELLKLVDNNLKLDEEDKEKNIEFLIKAAFFNEHEGEFSPYIKLRENDDFIENAFALDNYLFLKKLKEKCRFFRLESDSLAMSLKDNSFDNIDPIDTILFGQMSSPNRLSKNTLFNILLKKLFYLIKESLENPTNPEMPSFFTIDLIMKYLSIIFSKFPLLIPHLLNYPMSIMKQTCGKVSNFFIEKLTRYQKRHTLTFFEFVLTYYDISPNAFRQILLMITTISFHFYTEPNEPGRLISSAAKIRLILLKHFSFEFSNGYKLFSHGYSNGSDLHILSLRNNMQVTLILLKNEKNPKIIKNLLSEVKLAWIGLMEAAEGLQPAFLSILKNINFFGLLSILNKLEIQMLFEEKFQMKWQKNGGFLKNALNCYFSKNEEELIKHLDIEREKKRFEEFYNPNKSVSEKIGEEILIAEKEGETVNCKVDQNLFCPESKESMRVYGDCCFENLDNLLGGLPNVERVIKKGSVLYFSYDFSVSSNYILIPNLKLNKSSYVFLNLLSNLIDPSRFRRIPVVELNSEENEDNPENQENEGSQEILSSTESLIVSSRERLNEERSMEHSIERSLEQSVERSMDQSVEQYRSQSDLFREKRRFMFFQENFQLKRLMNEKVNIDILSKEIQKLTKDNKKKIASFLDEDLINDLNPKLKLEIKDYKKEQQIKESLNFSKNSIENEKNEMFPNECQSLEEIPSTIYSDPKAKENTSFFDFTSNFLFEVNQIVKSSLEKIFLCLYLHSEKTTEGESNCSSIFKLLKTYLFNPTSAVIIVHSLRILLVHHLEHMEPFFKITQKSQMEVSLEMISAIIGFLIKLMEKNYVLPLLFEKEVGAKNFELSFEFLKGKVGKMEKCNFFFLMLKQLKRFEYLTNMELSVNFKPVILTLTHFIKTYMVKNNHYLASEEELELIVLIFYERKLRLKYFELSLYHFFLEYNKNHINYISFFVKIIEFYCRKLTEHLNKNEFDENFNNDFHLFRHLIKDLISLTPKLDNKFFINLFESDFQTKFGLKISTYEGNKDTLSIQLKNKIDKWFEKRKKIYISNQLKEKTIANQIIVVFFSTLIQKICNSLSVSSAPNDLYLFFTYPLKAFLIFYQFISIPITKQKNNKEFSSFCPIKTYTTIDKLSSTHTIEEKDVNTSKSNDIINSNPSLHQFPSQITFVLPEKSHNTTSFPLLPTQTPILPTNSNQNILHNPFEILFESLYQEKLEKLMNFLIESKDNERLGNYIRYLEQADPRKIKLEIKIGYLRWITRKKLGGYRREGVVEIQIDRKKIWESTLEGLAGVEAGDLAGKVVRVGFLGEEGIDYGGVTREWLTLLSEEIFNPNFGLFCLTSNSISVMPSHYSKAIPDYLNHFRFIGRLLAKSLKDNLNFEVNLPNFLLKSILGITLTIKDLSSIDGELCKNLEWILKNNVDDLDLNFSYDLNVFDIPQMIELIPNGQCIKVNEQNKKEYVKLMCYAKMFSEIKDQTLSFIKGFNEVIPKEALVLFDEKELGMKLCGLSEIDLDDLIANLEYISYSRNHPLIVWLVKILSSYDQKALAKLLFFITGSFKVPLGGFKNFKIKIERVFDKESLPSAHTCFNQLDLPEYESEEKMREKLWLAINEGNKGFYIC